MCVNRKVTGFDFDGGYAEYMIVPAAALAAIPDELPAEEAGPFMCAGVTVYISRIVARAFISHDLTPQ
jgi:D-arabinose 1-dehydrogenase-like Zn-dependent alcohol dehydrogenase